MINVSNYKREIENMAVAARTTHSVQVAELTKGAYNKLKPNETLCLYNLEHQMRVSTVLAETTKGDYILVVAEKAQTPPPINH